MSERPYNLSYTQYCTLRGELHGEIFYSSDPSHIEITTGTKQDWIKKKWQWVPTMFWRRSKAGAQAAMLKVSRSIFPGRFKLGSKQGSQARQAEVFLRSKADVKAWAPWKSTATVQSKPVPVLILAEGSNFTWAVWETHAPLSHLPLSHRHLSRKNDESVQLEKWMDEFSFS